MLSCSFGYTPSHQCHLFVYTHRYRLSQPSIRLSRSDYQPATVGKMREAPKFAYDMAFDLKVLQNALRSASFLQDSGYRSQTALGRKPKTVHFTS
ncbi:hypothetical protein M3Y97_00313300 [Aphelenchoides bicaudatus]|nr:hypothetical protein M3Y97_00313300 [Aphelenchoides bicaudatus]